MLLGELDTALEQTELLFPSLSAIQQNDDKSICYAVSVNIWRKPQKINPQLANTPLVYDFQFANCKFP
jgi:hypothetical protein